MRKLTVKNFSVIKEAELEFGKITVLIGPQSSGKSLLCKLAYFLGFKVPEIAAEYAAYRRGWQSFLSFSENQFRKRFPQSAWGARPFSIAFESDSYSAEITGCSNEASAPLSLSFSKEFERFFSENQASDWGGNENPDDPQGNSIRRFFRSYRIMEKTNLLLGKASIEAFEYIPAGRSFFSNLNNVFALFQNENIDPILREFAGNLDWTDQKNSKARASNALECIIEMADLIQGGKVSIVDGTPSFTALDGRQLPLAILSSGTQELVPLLMLVTRLVRDSTTKLSDGGAERVRDHFLFVEEPEAHIFPHTQYQLVQLFSWISNEPTLGFTWAITTHSPYILSAFGNLLKAGKVGAQSAEHHAAVEKTIAEKYWIKSSDFTAYKIENGVLKSIFDKETAQIDGDYLDDVSSNIAEEFGQLLEIQYGG